MILGWALFGACAVVIGVAGVRLCRYGDRIAALTGAGRTWVGLILLATVTSLPELATGLTAAGVVGLPDIAVGDVLGSCVFNLLILVVLDALYRRGSFYESASSSNILAAGFSIILLGLVAFDLLLASHGLSWSIGRVGLSTPLLVLLYFLAIRVIFRHNRARRQEYVEAAVAEEQTDGMPLRATIVSYALWAVLLTMAAVTLPSLASRLAEEMGWEQSFMGTIFVACATSIPEVAVTLAAVRIGSIDLAVGNLLGSNLFNVLILAFDDAAYAPGPILQDVSSAHALTAVSSVLMTGIAIVGLLYHPPARIFRAVGWVSLLLLTVYIMNAYAIYLYRG